MSQVIFAISRFVFVRLVAEFSIKKTQFPNRALCSKLSIRIEGLNPRRNFTFIPEGSKPQSGLALHLRPAMGMTHVGLETALPTRNTIQEVSKSWLLML